MSEYNGWSNYETWVVKLWIDNDGYAGGAAAVEGEAERLATEYPDDRPYAVHTLAQFIAEAIDSDIEKSDKALSTGLWSDLLGRALSSVGWDEIAEAYLEQYEFESEDKEFETHSDSMEVES